MKRSSFVAVALAASWTFSIVAARAEVSFNGQCELEAVTCGALAGPFAKVGGCQYVLLGRVGEAAPKVGLRLELFLGVRLEGKVALLGGGEFEKGFRVECKVGIDERTGKPDVLKLRAGLEKLLRENPEFRKRYPSVEKVVVDPTLLFSQVPEKDAASLRKEFRKEK